MSQIAGSTHSAAPPHASPASSSSNPVLPASLPWIKRLVSMDTVSRNPNLGLIEPCVTNCARSASKPP